MNTPIAADYVNTLFRILSSSEYWSSFEYPALCGPWSYTRYILAHSGSECVAFLSRLWWLWETQFCFQENSERKRHTVACAHLTPDTDNYLCCRLSQLVYHQNKRGGGNESILLVERWRNWVLSFSSEKIIILEMRGESIEMLTYLSLERTGYTTSLYQHVRGSNGMLLLIVLSPQKATVVFFISDLKIDTLCCKQ